MSPLLHRLENEVQIAALIFLATIYIFRILWILRFRSNREKTVPAGSVKAGIAYSLMSIAIPRSMEAVRKRPSFYVQFVIFHLGVTAAISATFIIPYRPDLFQIKSIVLLFQIIIGAAFFVGLLRLLRRVRDPVVRLISTPDDYFSLALIVFYFGVGVLAVPNRYQAAEWPLILYFALTAFFLVYVPFSKISHYLYYPFARCILGRTMGHRGVFPLKNKGEKSLEAPHK